MAARALLVADLGTQERPLAAIASRLLRDRVTLEEEAGTEEGPLVLAISDTAIDRLLGGTYASVKHRADLGEYVTRALAPAARISLVWEAWPVSS
jgi:hypothetical protein